MSTKMKLYIGILVLIFAAVIALDINKQKPIDWRPTYSVNDKIPLGLYILSSEIEDLLDADVNRFTETPYEYFDVKYDTLSKDYDANGTFFAIAKSNPIDEQSAKELFYFVSRENKAFLSMKTFPDVFIDSLKIKVETVFQKSDSVAVQMANPNLGLQKYYLREDAGMGYFSEVDTANTTILGYMDSDSLRPNYIKVHYGNGDFYLHTQPAAFTNFHLLKNDHRQYAAKVLSYFKGDDLHWYVPAEDENISDSPLRYVFSQPPLTWAWYIFILGMLIFMLFNAKRKQRIVPEIAPLQNTTVEFAKTIGNLYYQEGDHGTIIDKKIIYFLERIRSEYLLDTTKLDDDFVRKLHQKSGKDISLIERAVFLINMHRKSYHGSVEDDLIQINNAIEKIIH